MIERTGFWELPWLTPLWVFLHPQLGMQVCVLGFGKLLLLGFR